jgi:hypothetical protein
MVGKWTVPALVRKICGKLGGAYVRIASVKSKTSAKHLLHV